MWNKFIVYFVDVIWRKNIEGGNRLPARAQIHTCDFFVKTPHTYGPVGQVVGARHERQRLRDQDQVNLQQTVI